MKLKNIDHKELIRNIGRILLSNKIIVTSAIILGVGVLVLQRIIMLTDPSVDKKHLKEQLSIVEEVKFNDEAIEQITKLNDTNINITSDFTDRNNPFVDR